MPNTLAIIPGNVSLSMLHAVYQAPCTPQLDPKVMEHVERSAQVVASHVQQGVSTHYGMDTGFGKLVNVRILARDAKTLQKNLILSHSCSVGAPLADGVVRLVMALKLISLCRGASGVRPLVVQTLADMLQGGILPVIPEKGSVGASGDLSPLSHMVLAMMGLGQVRVGGQTMASSKALQEAGIAPVELEAKEGVALINGTQTSTALALVGLFRAYRALLSSLVSGALSTDAAMASTSPFHPEIQELRGHQGQIDVACALRSLLDASEIRASHLVNDDRIQDPYSLRCQPQVGGACLDLLRQAAHTLRIEANAATDNPLVLSDTTIVSGGNFHAEPVAFAADQIAMAVCEIGATSQRRVALLVDSSLSSGLPPFLTRKPGLNSGFMTAEVTAAALMAENKQLAHPASVDSTPMSASQEDHVSMACHGARRLLQMTDNLYFIIGIEVLCGVQGIDLRAPLTTSRQLQSVCSLVRAVIPQLFQDRYMADDIAIAMQLVSSGRLIGAVDGGTLPCLENPRVWPKPRLV
ncbi:hypothetical protein CDD81_1939 [Ophiocordyceps australis]|uniref:Histidine ammonia-lyase n=1 Tax=Ophiocordyceps australis TaxID=1399860 RepID=A0A2C5X7V0_9HYPO|nr:hypothetical protein CDD81_1939 [Ophiocordyceps australis]